MRYFLCVVLLLGFTGCESLTKRHATRAILFAETPSTTSAEAHYYPPKQNGSLISGNPIFIHSNTKFSVRINEVNTGWIFRDSPKDQHANQNYKSTIANSTKSYNGDANNPISKRHFDHLRGHELWLLTTISSLNVNDPLETKSKRYFKATNVKIDSQSYSLIPFDQDEKYIFTHESDSSYRIKFQLYKVDGLALKKELAKISRNPGLVGVGEAVLATLKNTAGAVAGDLITSIWEEKSAEPLALERFLLSINATEELYGEVTILRNGDFLQRNPEVIFTDSEMNAIRSFTNSSDTKNYNFPKPFIENNYNLLDYFKDKEESQMSKIYQYGSESSKVDANGVIGNAYIEGNYVKNRNFNENKDLRMFGYIKLSVLESYSAKSYIDKDGKLQVSQVPETYQNELESLTKLLQEHGAVKLESEISRSKDAMTNQCPLNEAICIAPWVKDIADKQAKLNFIKASNPVLISAIEKYKKVTKLDEWKLHLSRQPD